MSWSEASSEAMRRATVAWSTPRVLAAADSEPAELKAEKWRRSSQSNMNDSAVAGA
ncbi:hypothetical protein D3C75_1390280 [compost metagenome]